MRNRYLDVLRAAAIFRVIVYHLFGWPWLTIVLPAMGVMFALGGSLMAASLDARPAGTVITSRLRRLLPPLWAFGLVAVPLMLLAGWAGEDGDHPLGLGTLAFWVLPLGDPTGSDWGIDLWEPLWYLRAYLWFVLLSPVLYAAYRRFGWAVVAAPLLLLAALEKTGFSLPETADAAMWDFAVYGACWIAGFAHHDGRLGRLRPWLVLATAAVLGAAALYWLRLHPGEDGPDLNDIPESQALWSLAFVLLALRWTPPMGWLARVGPLSALVDVCNARAVTLYLWHNGIIALVWPVLTILTIDDLGRIQDPVTLLAVLAMTAVAAAMFGWVEDLAARRRPRLWPSGTRAAARPTPAAPDPAVPDRAGPGPALPGPAVPGPAVPGPAVPGPAAPTRTVPAQAVPTTAVPTPTAHAPTRSTAAQAPPDPAPAARAGAGPAIPAPATPVTPAAPADQPVESDVSAPRTT